MGHYKAQKNINPGPKTPAFKTEKPNRNSPKKRKRNPIRLEVLGGGISDSKGGGIIYIFGMQKNKKGGRRGISGRLFHRGLQ